MISNQTYGTQRGTSFRKVIGRIVSFANNEIAELYPLLSYVEWLKIAHDEPFFTAAKELRCLTADEKREIKNRVGAK